MARLVPSRKEIMCSLHSSHGDRDTNRIPVSLIRVNLVPLNKKNVEDLLRRPENDMTFNVIVTQIIVGFETVLYNVTEILLFPTGRLCTLPVSTAGYQ